jgi:Carboxypeptidase regulatory-like domain/Tetratricopeptide repeat/TPR repeat
METMKRNAVVCVLTVLLLAAGLLPARSQSVGGTAEGKVMREGTPLPNVQVVLTNTTTTKPYKTKTDKNGEFALLGLPAGNYKIEVFGEKGEKLFTEMTDIGMQGNTSVSNILKIDISKDSQPVAEDNKFGVPDAPAPKLTKEQIAKIEADNKKIAGMNSLITEVQNARQAQDWPKAENALKQLLAAAPDTTRWDFYYFLGEAQSRSNKLPEAVQSYEKGIEVAKGVIAGTSPADSKIPTLNPAAAKAGTARMLTSQGNVYLKLQKQDEAIAALKKAAALDPSALNQYNLCGVAYTAQKYNEAKAPCNKYLELEPTGAHAEEVKAFLAEIGQK